MTETSCFTGKVVLRRLPDIVPGPDVKMPNLKRLLLPQGELAQVHDDELPIHYIATLELKEGSVRGNHLHRIKVEHTYVIRGELVLLVEEPESGERMHLEMPEGTLVIIQPGIAHAYRTIRPGIAVEFAPTQFDPNDIHKQSLI